MAGGGPAGRAVVVTACVAAALTLLALAGAILLRPHQTGTGAGAPGNTGSGLTTAAANATLQCSDGPCRSLASTTVAGSTVQLLANGAATTGRVRIVTPQGLDSVFETTISQLGAKLTAQSLSCVNATTPVCMVSGTGSEGSAGEVFLETGGDWARADAPYFASGGYIGLRADGSQGPEVLTAQTSCDANSPQCPTAPVYLQVFTVTGDTLGCTSPVSRLDRLPGWPNVTVTQSQLRDCP
jgi:hypothetical protein